MEGRFYRRQMQHTTGGKYEDTGTTNDLLLVSLHLSLANSLWGRDMALAVSDRLRVLAKHEERKLSVPSFLKCEIHSDASEYQGLPLIQI